MACGHFLLDMSAKNDKVFLATFKVVRFILGETITCSPKSHLTIKNVPEVSAMPLAVNGADKKSFANVDEIAWQKRLVKES